MHELEQARALLPAWVSWAGPVTYLLWATAVTGVVTQIVVSFAMLGYPKSAEVHWTEKARWALPARALGILCVLMLPAMAAVYAHFWAGPLVWASSRVLEVTAALTTLAVTMVVYYRLMGRTVPDPPRLGYWLKGTATTLLVIRPMLVVVVAMIFTAPDALISRAGAVWGALALLLLGLAAGGATVRLGRALGLVRPASERLEQVVAAAAERAGHRPRAAYELVWPMANAAAYPMAGVLVFSDAVLRLLDDDELEAITAHELGHLTEPRGVKALRVLQALLWVPIAALRSIVNDHGLPGLVVVLVGTLLVFVLLRRMVVRMERRADARAREQVDDPASLARALEKLYRHNGMPAVGWARGSHPHLYDRMVAAGHTPDFDRPPPPSRGRLYVGLLAAIALSITLLIGASWAPTYAVCEETVDDEWPCLVWIASGNASAWELGTLAEIREARGRRDEAITLYRAAVELSAEPSAELGRLVVLLVLDGRCDEAAAAFGELQLQVARVPEGQEHLDYAATMMATCSLLHQSNSE